MEKVTDNILLNFPHLDRSSPFHVGLLFADKTFLTIKKFDRYEDALKEAKKENLNIVYRGCVLL